VKPAQGGFMVVRPNNTVYEDIKAIVRKGSYGNKGWENRTGKFWGSMTFQGLIPYYFLILHPGHAVELNRCIHDNMASAPKSEKDQCFTQEDECEDCRERPLQDLYSAHFTVCAKPWECLPHIVNNTESHYCRMLDGEWFKARSELEKSWGRSGMGASGDWNHKEHFWGYCKGKLSFELMWSHKTAHG
jgi:hypothetical protein